MTLSDRIAIFNDGRLQQLGTPEDVYFRPANRFIANFVGDREANFFNAELSQENGKPVLRGPGLDLALDRRLPARAPRNVLAGVRAESIDLLDLDSPDLNATAIVTDVELVGADLYVFVKIAGGDEICCRRDPRDRLAVGRPVGLRLKQGDIHLFDPETDACISHGDANSTPLI